MAHLLHDPYTEKTCNSFLSQKFLHVDMMMIFFIHSKAAAILAYIKVYSCDRFDTCYLTYLMLQRWPHDFLSITHYICGNDYLLAQFTIPISNIH